VLVGGVRLGCCSRRVHVCVVVGGIVLCRCVCDLLICLQADRLAQVAAHFDRSRPCAAAPRPPLQFGQRAVQLSGENHLEKKTSGVALDLARTGYINIYIYIHIYIYIYMCVNILYTYQFGKRPVQLGCEDHLEGSRREQSGVALDLAHT